MKLTPKQQIFVANKAAGATNRDAAIAAGYSMASADVRGSELNRLPNIKAAIKAATKSVSVDTGAGTQSMLRDHYDTPLDFMADVMNNEKLPIGMRMEAAKQMLPYQHARMGEKGKKESAKERAAEISAQPRGTQARATRSPKAPPVLRSIQGGKEV